MTKLTSGSFSFHLKLSSCKLYDSPLGGVCFSLAVSSERAVNHQLIIIALRDIGRHLGCRLHL